MADDDLLSPFGSLLDFGSVPLPGQTGQSGGFNPLWADAMGTIESSNRYDAVTDAGRGRRALGRYQILDTNLGQWLSEAGMPLMSPKEFLDSPDAQDALFRHRFGMMAAQNGPQRAAELWLGTGPSDRFGTTPSSHGVKFMATLAQLERQGGGSPPMALGGPSPSPTGPSLGPAYDRLLQPVRTSGQEGSASAFFNRDPLARAIFGRDRQPTVQEADIEGHNLRVGAQVEAMIAKAIGRGANPADIAALGNAIERARELGGTPQQQYSRVLQDTRVAVALANLGVRGDAILKEALTSGAQAQPYTLTPGQQRYAPNGTPIGPAQPAQPPAPQPFTLGEGQRRYGPDGQMIVENPRPAPGDNARGTHGAKMLEETMTQGRTAATLGGDLQQLLSLSRQWGEGGMSANARQWAANRLGLDIGQGTTAQQFQAIVNRIVNQLPRAPGSQSNFEAQNLLASLPTLAATPAARENVIRRLAAMAEDNSRRGDVAADFYAGNLTMNEAFRKIQDIDRETAGKLKELRESLDSTWRTTPGGGRFRRE